MRALEFITGHVIYNLAYTYKFQLKNTKDNDCRITFAQMKKLFATLYLKKGHYSSFSALRHFWAIKIDFMTFLDFLEKCQLLYLLDKLNESSEEELDEETKKQLFQGSDQNLVQTPLRHKKLFFDE